MAGWTPGNRAGGVGQPCETWLGGRLGLYHQAALLFNQGVRTCPSRQPSLKALKQGKILMKMVFQECHLTRKIENKLVGGETEG